MPAPADQLPDPALRFESVLAELIDTHEQMVAIALDHRAAIARADAVAVQACIGQQAVLSARVAALENQRRELAAALAPSKPGSPAPTISAVAQNLPEPIRARVLAAAARLREVLLRLQRENSILRTATQALMAHMDGLIQQVARALSQTRLYGPQGRIDVGGPVACGIDLTH